MCLRLIAETDARSVGDSHPSRLSSLYRCCECDVGLLFDITPYSYFRSSKPVYSYTASYRSVRNLYHEGFVPLFN